jgi:3-hydroxyisobutyrate dehydrogenase-like beta-hydroxyacid dehydrogenase
MGYEMARRLLDAGHDVGVYNRTRAKAEPLAERGATLVGSPAELADRDIVFTMVAGSPDFAAVTIGDGGVLRSPDCAPRILVDCSTVSTEVSAQVRGDAAGRGTAVLAAPVSGNGKVVRAGKLSTVVSGPAAAYAEVRPYLACIGRAVSYAGEGDVARLVKLAHNVFLGVVSQSLAEITVLAEKGGVPRAAFLEFLNDSVLGSTFTRYKTPALVNLDWTPTFTTVLLRKDFDLGLAAARTLEVPMPLAALAAQLVQAAAGRGHGNEDFSALLEEVARGAGMRLEPEGVAVSDGLETEGAE